MYNNGVIVNGIAHNGNTHNGYLPNRFQTGVNNGGIHRYNQNGAEYRNAGYVNNVFTLETQFNAKPRVSKPVSHQHASKSILI